MSLKSCFFLLFLGNPLFERLYNSLFQILLILELASQMSNLEYAGETIGLISRSK